MSAEKLDKQTSLLSRADRKCSMDESTFVISLERTIMVSGVVLEVGEGAN